MSADHEDLAHADHLGRVLAAGLEAIRAGMPAMLFATWPKPDGTIAKAPAHVHGHLDATLDAGLYRELLYGYHRPRGVPAEHELLAGFVPGPGGRLVLDCDAKGGRRGVAWLQGAIAKWPELGAAVWSTPSGGRNVLVDKPDPAMVVGSGLVWEGVDVCGDGRGVVAPGQVSSYGGAWRWRAGGYGARAVLPAELAANLGTGAPTGYTRAAKNADVLAFMRRSTATATIPAWVAFERWLDECEWSAGSRHDTLRRLVARCFGMRHLDLERAMDRICHVWASVVAGEGRDGEPWEVARWVVGQELASTVAASVPSTLPPRDTGAAPRSLSLAELEGDEAPPIGVDPTTGEVSSFRRVDPTPYLDGTVARPAPTLLRMDGDGPGLLYHDRLNGIHGDSGSGKSWAVAFAAAQEILAGRRVMLVDVEDDMAPLVVRLRQIGVPDAVIADGVVFVHPSDSFTYGHVDELIDQAVELGVVHVFVDSLGEAFALDGIDENNDAEVAPWLARVVRRIIDQAGAGVTLVDHVTKGDGPHLHAKGTARKRAAITGAAWLAVAVEPFGLDTGGRLALRCAKDRHGNYRRGDTVAELVMSPRSIITGRSELELRPHLELDPDLEERRSVELVEAVLDRLEAVRPAELNRNAVCEALREQGITARDTRVDGALELAVARGYASARPGARRSTLYRFERRFGE